MTTIARRQREAACVALALTIGAACGSADAPGTATSRPSASADQGSTATALTADALALDSAVGIVAVGCGPQPHRGIGGVLDATHVVTTAHTVAGSTHVEVEIAEGSALPAEVVLLDELLDVALVRLEAHPGRPAVLDAERPERDADGVVAVHAPDGAGLETRAITVLRPVTIRTTDIHRRDPVERPGYELAATVEPGDSGTLVHVAGGAIGIVWARSTETPGRAWAVALPDTVTEPSARDALAGPVATGECV